MDIVVAYLSGVVTLGYLVAGVFFSRFWRRTGDRLFLAFAVAFGLLSLNQILSTWIGLGAEHVAFAYLFRVLGFTIILVAIVDKNLPNRR